MVKDFKVPKKQSSQLEIGIQRSPEQDRNYHLGGRSFYFFDFDDNVAFLSTPLILFHKETGSELAITSGQYAQEHAQISKLGIYADYQIRWEDLTGTFRCFRDHDTAALQSMGLRKQIFIHDVAEALGFPDFQWKGPSWSCFYHATFNQRPISVITARGHHPSTIQDGIDLFVKAGHLPLRPNFLGIFPVSYPSMRSALGDQEQKESVAELKQRAIRASVEKAFQVFGYSPHHRFGMSDDDPRNVQLIVEEMMRLKTTYPEVSFFVIETQKGDFIKHEISHGSNIAAEEINAEEQIQLF